jgi:hypothetical protein
MQFYVPAILEDGWTVYMWDMVSRDIHVLDPRCGPYGHTQVKKDRHELIASRLHDSMFECFHEFFAGWPIQKTEWGTKFPRIANTNYSRCKHVPPQLYFYMHSLLYNKYSDSTILQGGVRAHVPACSIVL